MNLFCRSGRVTKALNGFVVFITACALAACGGGDGFTGNTNQVLPVASAPLLTTAPMLVAPAAASASVGDVLFFSVSGGEPSYEVVVNNTSIAITSTPIVSTSGGTFSLNLLKVGTTTIAITDGLGQTQTVTLTVDAAIAKLRLAPTELTIDENFKGSITFNIYGGSADSTYTIFTSDQAFFNAPAPTQNMTFSSGLGTSSDRCIVPNNFAPANITGIYDVQITVVDQSGASAFSVVSIRDNARGCP